MRTRTLPFTSDGLELVGELVSPETPRAVAILCHGIPSGHPPDPTDDGYGGLARRFAAAGTAGFWFDFRGCRQAPGDFSMRGWVQDVASALDALSAVEGLTAVPRVLVGSSAGGAAVVAATAAREDVAGVATLASVASWSFDGLMDDPEALLLDFRNRGIVRDPAFPPDIEAWAAELSESSAERAIASVAPRPVLLVHGDADDVVSYAHAERLFTLAAEPKELVRIPGGTHQLRRDERAIEAVLDWLDRHFPLVGDGHGPAGS